MTRPCKVCNVEIPEARLEVLPDTETCVNHSEAKPYRAFVTGTTKSKNNGLEIMKADDPAVKYWESRK